MGKTKLPSPSAKQARAANNKQSPTVGLDKDFSENDVTKAYTVVTRKRKGLGVFIYE